MSEQKEKYTLLEGWKLITLNNIACINMRQLFIERV
jgi:hypothetical protein